MKIYRNHSKVKQTATALLLFTAFLILLIICYASVLCVRDGHVSFIVHHLNLL